MKPLPTQTSVIRSEIDLVIHANAVGGLVTGRR
jgi:hypothetical protein